MQHYDRLQQQRLKFFPLTLSKPPLQQRNTRVERGNVLSRYPFKEELVAPMTGSAVNIPSRGSQYSVIDQGVGIKTHHFSLMWDNSSSGTPCGFNRGYPGPTMLHDFFCTILALLPPFQRCWSQQYSPPDTFALNSSLESVFNTKQIPNNVAHTSLLWILFSRELRLGQIYRWKRSWLLQDDEWA